MNTTNITITTTPTITDSIIEHCEVFIVAAAGILAVFTPIYDPLLLIKYDRLRYMRQMRSNNFYIGPTVTLFTIMVLFWNTLLPFFQLHIQSAIVIIGSIYLYLLLLYSIIDEMSTSALSAYFIVNLMITISFYRDTISEDNFVINIFLLFIFNYLSYVVYMKPMGLQQSLRWYIWYAGTMAGTLRW